MNCNEQSEVILSEIPGGAQEHNLRKLQDLKKPRPQDSYLVFLQALRIILA